LEHVAVLEFDAGAEVGGEGLFALGEEALASVLHFEGEGGEVLGEGGGEVAVAAADVEEVGVSGGLVGFKPVVEERVAGVEGLIAGEG